MGEKACKYCKRHSNHIKRESDEVNQGEGELKGNKIPKCYTGQKILWYQRMSKLGPGKFRIRWSGPYIIKEIYNNNTMDVITLQGENIGRVNMSKIKPYHESLRSKYICFGS